MAAELEAPDLLVEDHVAALILLAAAAPARVVSLYFCCKMDHIFVEFPSI
jgi:hypothetical protein